MCDVCHGLSGCPACEAEVKYDECPECFGEGYFLLDEDGDIVSRETYNRLPHGGRTSEMCTTCGGQGKVMVEEDR
jgi:RecJ-like exonuclease